jgi:hypothetical protein
MVAGIRASSPIAWLIARRKSAAFSGPRAIEQIERIQERLARPLAAEHGAHGIKVGFAVRSADHAFTVDRNRRNGEGLYGLDDRRQLFAPVVTAA